MLCLCLRSLVQKMWTILGKISIAVGLTIKGFHSFLCNAKSSKLKSPSQKKEACSDICLRSSLVIWVCFKITRLRKWNHYSKLSTIRLATIRTTMHNPTIIFWLFMIKIFNFLFLDAQRYVLMVTKLTSRIAETGYHTDLSL